MSYKNDTQWHYMSMNTLAYREEFADNDDKGYTKKDLIDLVNGNEETAKALFELLDWQSPHTLIDEWQREGEIDENFNLTGGE